MTHRPNLLTIMTDHQRADTIGMVQDGKEVTPNLNRLAAQSTVFERAYTSCPLCVPARTSLATGIYPTRHGTTWNDWQGTNAGDFDPIHQMLSEAGYDVAHIGVDHIQTTPKIAERGPFHFVRFSDHREMLKDRGLEMPNTDRYRTLTPEDYETGTEEHPFSNYKAGPWPLDESLFLDAYLADEALSWLGDRTGDEPFALFLYLWSPHPPLCVPEPYYSMFDPEALDLPENVGVVPDEEPPNRRQGIAARMAESATMDDWRKAWSAHLGLTALADAALGRVLDAMTARDDSDRTVTMFMSDHGDHMGQHRMYQKMDMYEPALRVPMMMRLPDGEPRRVSTPVSHLDVVPTTLDLLGLPARRGLDGRSIARAVTHGDDIEEQPVFSQYSGNLGVADLRRSVVMGRYKYVWAPDDQVELFDLEADPLEMDSLAGRREYERKQAELHEMCREWGTTHGDWLW